MAQQSTVMEAVKNFILAEFLAGENPENLTPSTLLMTGGILDSIATLKLIMFLEQEFEIQVEPDEVDEQHLNTLDAICALVASKKA